MSALDKQVGGSHYKLPYEPIKFITETNLDFVQGSIVKYVSRYKNKGGRIDLEKAVHYAQLGEQLTKGLSIRKELYDVVEEFTRQNNFSEKQTSVIRFVVHRMWWRVEAVLKEIIKEEYES
jgi:hypothetical protein